MLKIVANPEFTQTVKVQVPSDGGPKEHSFKARFRALRVSEMADYNMATGVGNVAFLKQVFVGWDGLADEDGHVLEFGVAARDLIIDIPYLRQALVLAYFETTAGLNAATRGN